MGEVVENKKLTLSDCLLDNGGDSQRIFNENYLRLFQHEHSDVGFPYLVKFIQLAQLTGADPRKNQIHLTSYFDRNSGGKVGVPVFSYHFFLDKANQTGQMKGVTVDSQVEEVFNPVTNKVEKQLVSTAIASREGRKDVTFKARWSEFNNAKNPMWRNKPYTMLQKCAIAGALRWQFPETLGNMFIQEEMRDQDTLEAVANVIDAESNQEALSQYTSEEREPGNPEYVFLDGKFRGKRLNETDFTELEKYYDYLEKKKNKGTLEEKFVEIFNSIQIFLENEELCKDINPEEIPF
jgi:phage recombination protein Bet